MTLQNFDRLRSVLYPPSSDTLSNILMQGFRDAHRFLRKQGLVSCSQCMTVTSTLHHDTAPHTHTPDCEHQPVRWKAWLFE